MSRQLSPPSISSGELKTNLFPHQLQALEWMIDHEHPVVPTKPDDKEVQFWTWHEGLGDDGEDGWYNSATHREQYSAPLLGRGGIVGDGMGLGKTLTTLALVLSTRKDRAPKGFNNATLIICPLPLLEVWTKQISEHVVSGKLTCCVYHGASKDVLAPLLESYDVVLATYQTIAAEVPTSAYHMTPRQKKKRRRVVNKGGPLSKIKWKRIVADEGHVLQNPDARMTQAFTALQADRRWICSGTPMINSPRDLGSLLRCLHLCSPLDRIRDFSSMILKPLLAENEGYGEAKRLLQAIVDQIMIRRTKESLDKDNKPLVALPPIKFTRCLVALDEATRKIYDEVQVESARRFREHIKTDGNPAHLLASLTRMRQLCLSVDMVPASFLDEMRNPLIDENVVARTIASLAPKDKERLNNTLQNAVADGEECCVCYENLSNACITDCGHAFCQPCILEVVKAHSICPLDRHPLTEASLLELPEYIDENQSFYSCYSLAPSAKIDELIKQIKCIKQSDKALVFSQFTRFLDLIAAALRKEGVKYCHYDGSMSVIQRETVLASFRTPVSEARTRNTPVVMLISLKSGAVGLDLTVANYVFLCDPWWQGAIERQAVDRAHRVGQRKPVKVVQLIAEDTVEERVLMIQERKDALINQAYEKMEIRRQRKKFTKKQLETQELMQILGVE